MSGTVSSTAALATITWSALTTPLRVQPDVEVGQEPELRAGHALVERPVGPLHAHAHGLDDEGERQHAAAADAGKEVGSVAKHVRAIYGRGQGGKRPEGR
jgi:hypothetical protein